MANTNKIKIVNGFADETTRDIEFVGFDSDCAVLTPNTLRSRIQNLNSDTSAFNAFYLSDGGQSFTGVVGATITKIKETDINLKVSE
jgi:hypothetical protein